MKVEKKDNNKIVNITMSLEEAGKIVAAIERSRLDYKILNELF